MKNLLPLFFAFLGAAALQTTQAQTYDPLAVQRINDLITNNGLQATYNAPETWQFVAWNDETPKQLIRVGLLNNKITGDASFAGLTRLYRIWCYNNTLTKLDLTNCTALEELQASFNRLTQIVLTNCINLQALVCDNNNLTELDLTCCIKLEGLTCDKNQLRKLDLPNCMQLGIYCANNKLTELNLKTCVQIVDLNCYKNCLTELDLSRFNNLYDFEGYGQSVSLTMFENEIGEYTHSILLNNPNFGENAISYWDGILKSVDTTVTSTSFTVKTIGKDFQLSGTMNFDYTKVGVNEKEKVQLKVYPNPTTGELRITNYEY